MVKETKSTKPSRKPVSRPPALVKFYLVAYNALSAVGWAYVLGLVVVHLFNLNGEPQEELKGNRAKAAAGLVPWLEPILVRARSFYSRAGPATAFVQSFAVLEVVHAALGWVRSPVPTTAMQVASRLLLVWGIMARFQSVSTNPLFASMVLAWSFTEVIRYTFYAFNLVGYNPHFLLYLRYTTFYLLYPIGAGSEAFLMFATLPEGFPATWAVADYGRAALFAIWWPGLYVMYTYMISQRRKTLGPAKPPKAKAT